MDPYKINGYLSGPERSDEADIVSRFREMSEEQANSLYPGGLHLSNGDILVKTDLQIENYLKEMKQG